jgi:heat shock protein HtpX
VTATPTAPQHPATTGWKWVDRRLHAVAVRLTDRQFEALAGGPLVRRQVTVARLVTVGAAALLVAGVLAIAALGVWLAVAGAGLVTNLLGVLLIGVALVLRPRLGRLGALLGDTLAVDRTAAPELFGLVDRVRTAVGAPTPHVILLGYDRNAFTTTVGLRRRRVLCLGLPLLATLDPQERVALIGHELGHFVNGDVRRGPLTLAARTTLGRLALLFAPAPGGDGGFVDAIARSVSWVISRLAMTAQLVLLWASLRDSQRAEYLADELGARTGGSDAAIRLADSLLLTEAIDTVIRREASARQGIAAWRAAAATARANQAARLPQLRELSRHADASLFASHPPAGLRSRMLERRPRHPAAVTLDEATSARIDGELAPFEARVRRVLADGGLAPARRPLGRAVLIAAALVLLGLAGREVVQAHNGPRPIVVAVDADASDGTVEAIDSFLGATPGVTHVDLYAYQDDQLHELATGARDPYWFQVTTTDRAAMHALQAGTFAVDLRALPAVVDVYFDCRDLTDCRDRRGK